MNQKKLDQLVGVVMAVTAAVITVVEYFENKRKNSKLSDKSE